MKMLPTTSQDYVNFKFHIIKNNDFNACAYSDGNIFINTRLLLKAENISQLAAVLSHEIAHVVNKHSRKIMKHQNVQGISWTLFLKSLNKSRILHCLVSTNPKWILSCEPTVRQLLALVILAH
jgi:predicted Zn-dependent protease